MKNKLKYVVSFFDSSNECVFQHVVSSRSAFEAVVNVVLTVSLSFRSDVYSRLKDCAFTVSCCPYVDSDFLGGD